MEVESGKSFTYAYDGNGNVGQVIDSVGGIGAYYEYDAYGKLISSSGIFAEVNPYRFSTKYFDTETDLYYYGYRYYDPTLGRWLTRDPIEEEGGINLYGFVGNEPVGGVDPFGNVRRGRNARNFQNRSDFDINVPPKIDGMFKVALEKSLKSCFLRCYLTDLSDEDINQMFVEIENRVPLEERDAVREWVRNLPVNAGAKMLVGLNTAHLISARLPQGIGLPGKVLHKKVLINDSTRRLVRRRLYHLSVKAVGKGGVKYFTRIGSKFLPFAISWYPKYWI